MCVCKRQREREGGREGVQENVCLHISVQMCVCVKNMGMWQSMCEGSGLGLCVQTHVYM